MNVSPIDWTALSWTRSTLTHDQVITWTKAKVHVYSESVRLMQGEYVKKRTKDGKIMSNNFDSPNLLQRFLNGIDGEPIELEWNIFPGLTSLEILQKIQKDLQDQTSEL